MEARCEGYRIPHLPARYVRAIAEADDKAYAAHARRRDAPKKTGHAGR